MAAVKSILMLSAAKDAAKDAAFLRKVLRKVQDNDLENILALLAWMAQDFLKLSCITEHDILDNAFDLVIERCSSWDAASIARLSKLTDIMILNKDGELKNAHETLTFMREVAIMREGIRRKSGDNATERVVPATTSDNATEHVELDEEEVSLCYQRFGRTLITKSLRPHQKRDWRYCLRNDFENDTHLTTFQRSFTDNLLRKFLGDKKVAFLIWQHGLPSIADRPLVWRRKDKHRENYLGMLQSSLKNCLEWYNNLAKEIVVHKTQAGFVSHQSSSSLDEDDRHLCRKRRAALQEAQDALWRGAELAWQRDVGKRSYDEMDQDEQDILHNFETGRTKKAKQSLIIPKMKPFRCKLQLRD